MREAGPKEILLPQMAELRACFLRHRQMIIDHQSDPRPARDRQDRPGHAADFFERGLLGAKLNQISAAFAERLRHRFRARARADTPCQQRRKAGIVPEVSWQENQRNPMES